MSKTKSPEEPRGELAIRTLAMPANTNPAGDIFGGWVLSQMDIAGGLVTKKIAHGRTVTVAIESLAFHLPVFMGDTVCCYVEMLKVGRTSMKVNVEVWAQRQYEETRVKVTEAVIVYVAVCSNRKPRPVDSKYK